jgi:hypothetical protein
VRPPPTIGSKRQREIAAKLYQRTVGPRNQIRLLGLSSVRRMNEARTRYRAAGAPPERPGARWFTWSPLAGHPTAVATRPWVVASEGAPRVDFA